MEGRKMRQQQRDLIDDILAAGTNAKKIDKILDRAEDQGIPLTRAMFDNEILRKNITRGQRAFLNADLRIRATLGGVIAAGETQRVDVERLIFRETR